MTASLELMHQRLLELISEVIELRQENGHLRAQVAELTDTVQDVAAFLDQKAQQADEFHEKQEAAFDKWLKSGKGGKSTPAVALPIAAQFMYSAATSLRAALKKVQS